MKGLVLITAFLLSLNLTAAAQLKSGVPLQRVLPDTTTPKPALKPLVVGLNNSKKVSSSQPLTPLRTSTVPAGEARYNAQYKAYQQQKLSGVKDFSAPATYVPPPQEKVKLLTKKPKQVPKCRSNS